jgi:hypothetical protein
VREHERDDRPSLPFDSGDSINLGEQHRLQFWGEVHKPTFVVLGCARLESQRTCPKIELATRRSLERCRRTF